MTDIAIGPDLAAIKQRQQATWASGDYHMIGTQILLSSELLIESLDVHAGERVLDVATGSGNAALAAARRGCTVIGIDYVPELLERARLRAAAEGVVAEFIEGDAEALPFEDASFDVVASVFGAMFAPDQDQAARELARVCRPGGRIGLVAHTPTGSSATCSRSSPATSRRRRASARRSSGAPRNASASCSAIGSMRSASRSGTSSGATRRRRRTSSTGAATTVRRSRRSRLSVRPAAMGSRETCSTSSLASTALTTAR